LQVATNYFLRLDLGYSCDVMSVLTCWMACLVCGGREFVSQWPAKSYTALQTVFHRFNIYASSCVALALWRKDGHHKLVTRFGVHTLYIRTIL